MANKEFKHGDILHDVNQAHVTNILVIETDGVFSYVALHGEGGKATDELDRYLANPSSDWQVVTNLKKLDVKIDEVCKK